MSDMFNLSLNRGGDRSKNVALALMTVLLAGTLSLNAQTVKIALRPLTPQEIKNYGLTNTTQLASGLQNVGLGQPAYLQAFVTKGTVVTQINWSLPGKPPSSITTLQDSPLTNLPAYDTGDRELFDIISRKMLVPDVKSGKSLTSLTNDYTVVLQVGLTNKTVSVTNIIYCSTYEGMEGQSTVEGVTTPGCVFCHEAGSGGDQVTTFRLTQHADAFKRKINGIGTTSFGANCISCHVLGYDKTSGATNGGFDDVALQVGWTNPPTLTTNNWAAMDPNLQVKANIQCENCHGPGSRHLAKGGGVGTNYIGISLSAGNCGQCHDSMTHHVKNYQWGQTLHANGGLETSSSCQPCHTSKGFIVANDPAIREDGTTNQLRSTLSEGIACAACHDPHTAGMGESQLRNIPSATFVTNSLVVTEGGEGLLCMRCHHDRYDANARWKDYSRGAPAGPHHGVQGDMLFGTNAIQYGMSMPSSRHWDVVKDTCVTCHMQDTPTNGPAMNKVGAHTFMIGWSDGTNTVHLTEACVGCHGEIESFNFGGEDYDQDGAVEGVQKEISDMQFQLASLLPPYSGTNIDTTGWPTNYAADFNRRAARYNWLIVNEDGSKGVHNPKYTAAILRASIDDLRGGIDVDHDGLRDDWEITYFGNDLTSQSGTGDADSDGLSNAQEMAAGTRPDVKDTDTDGIWDLAELQAGTDPTNQGSTPGTNQVYILPAVELAYVPEMFGVTQQFQTVSALGDPAAWTNLGPSFISSNAWFYQLMSTRDAVHKFFRVVTTP